MADASTRPFRPGELTASTFTSFPLQAMAHLICGKLAEGKGIQDQGR